MLVAIFLPMYLPSLSGVLNSIAIHIIHTITSIVISAFILLCSPLFSVSQPRRLL